MACKTGLSLKGCKFSPNQNPPFFAPEQSEVKPIIHEKVQTTQQELYFCENSFTYLLWQGFHCCSSHCSTYIFLSCKHIHMWELTSTDVCLNLNSLSGPSWLGPLQELEQPCSGRRCWRAGSRWTGGKAPNWPEWLQSEPISDKHWIALQIGSDSIVLCDPATTAMLTKQRTGVQALLC